MQAVQAHLNKEADVEQPAPAENGADEGKMETEDDNGALGKTARQDKDSVEENDVGNGDIATVIVNAEKADDKPANDTLKLGLTIEDAISAPTDKAEQSKKRTEDQPTREEEMPLSGDCATKADLPVNNAPADKASALRTAKSRPAKKHRQHKIFQDCISVFIPIDVTADLRIAIQKTRAKRIKSIRKRFPSLKEPKKTREDEDEDAILEDEDEENKEKEPAKNIQKKKKPLAHVPQPHQYGSVLDYLEAKYVKGVMLGDDEDENGTSMDEKSEGAGSVYSQTSFLDDTDLQRDVAEQVMASTTMTKLELEEDDGDFFVNVGNLEVEDNEYDDHYDPLQDKEQTTKKRKKSQTSKEGDQLTKKTKQGKPEDNKKASSKSPQNTKGASLSSTASPKNQLNDEEKKRLTKLARQMKANSEDYYRKVVTMIKQMTEEEIPRRRTKLKVALTCPPNKKPGDDITFT